jgi:hypothetical protein
VQICRLRLLLAGESLRSALSAACVEGTVGLLMSAAREMGSSWGRAGAVAGGGFGDVVGEEVGAGAALGYLVLRECWLPQMACGLGSKTRAEYYGGSSAAVLCARRIVVRAAFDGSGVWMKD